MPKTRDVAIKEEFVASKFFPDAALQLFYNQMNEAYFDFKLPFVCVGYTTDSQEKKRYGSTVTLLGAAYPFYIQINKKISPWYEVVRLTILHEMIHVKLTGERGDRHGKAFQKERARLGRLGAFNQFI